MTAAILAIALAAADDPILESYSDLTRLELLHQRRLLKENDPVMFAPVLITSISPLIGFIGSGFLADGLSSFFINKTGQSVAGGFVMALGIAGLIGGTLWLVKTVMSQKATAARVEEIEALLATGGFIQPPPMP